MAKKVAISVALALALGASFLFLLYLTSDFNVAPPEVGRTARLTPLRSVEDGAGVTAVDPVGGVAAEGDGQNTEIEASTPLADDRPISVTGRIFNPNGEGIGGATVVAVGTDAWGDPLKGIGQRFDDPISAISALSHEYREIVAFLEKARSAEDGRYELRGLAPGGYDLYASHADHRSARSEGVRIEPAKTATRDVEMQPGEMISGVVLDAEDRPVEGALITCVKESRANTRGGGLLMQQLADFADARAFLGSEVRSVADGSFHLGSLESVVYEVRATRPGFAPAKVGKVPAGTSGIVLLLSPGSTVVGRVVDPDGDPILGATIELRAARPDWSRLNRLTRVTMDYNFLSVKTLRANSDEKEGRFTIAITDVTTGEFDLVVRAEEYPEYSTRVIVDAERVDLGDVALSHECPISGLVIGPDGFGVEGARVSAIEPRQSSVRSRAETDAKGRFTLPGLSEGQYVLEAEADDHPPMRSNLVDAGRENVTLTLRAGFTVRGVVLLASDRSPVEGAKVKTYSSPRRSTETDANGEFEIRGVGADEHGRLSICALHPDFKSLSKNVELRSETTFEFLLSGGIRLRGVVLSDGGEPVPRAQVRLGRSGVPEVFFKLGGQGNLSTTTDEEGVFEFAVGEIDGPPLPVKVVATHASHGRGVFTIGTEEYKQMRDSGDAMDDIEIVLGRGSAIAGRVVDRNGGSVPRVRLEAKPHLQPTDDDLDTQLMLQIYSSFEDVVGYSAEDGSYRIEGLDAGLWTVEATAVGYACWKSEPFDVPPGEKILIDVMLDAGGTITGKVVDHEGQPLVGVEVVALPELEIDEKEREHYEAQYMARIKRATARGVAQNHTDEDGRYELTHLPEGSFVITGRLAGYFCGSIAGVEAGDKMDDLVITPYSQIQGVVRDRATGNSITRYNVKADRVKDAAGLKVETQRWGRKHQKAEDPDGLFFFDELQNGAYRLSVKRDGYLVFREEVTVAPGELRTVEVLLDQGARVSGIAMDFETGEAIEGVTLELQPKDWKGARESGVEGQERRSAADGTFTFGAVADGTYVLEVGHDGHEWYYLDGGELELTIRDCQPVEVEVRLRLGGSVRGQLTTSSSEEQNLRYLIEFDPREELQMGNKTRGARPGGDYSVHGLRPGKYVVKVYLVRGDSDVRSVDFGEVEVRPGEATQLDIDLARSEQSR